MIRYLLGEMIPTFFMGVVVFIFILLMFQALRLTEQVLVHGVKITVIAEMMGYLSTSFLPILFPMALLFAVLMTYSRLSSDSEVVAFRAVGLGMPSIIAPAVILSILIGILSLQTSFHIAPWGNRQFELLITKLGSEKPTIAIKEATFSKDFFDLVVYANKVDSKTGRLEHVFIYDERSQETPITVIAKEGAIIQDQSSGGHAASLRLTDGSIHRTSDGRHTKIDFSTYDVFLSDPVQSQFSKKSPPSLTIEELNERLKDPKLEIQEKLELKTEFHKRSALAFACILFALIGVGLGTTTNRRNAKSGGMVLCVGLIIVYYILYVVAEGASRKGQLPPYIAMWAANGLFTIAAGWSLRRAWH
jgi:LPS export ABC transporter permease LptF